MKALKYVLVTATFLLAPTLQAADVFVSHYEPLHSMTAQIREAFRDECARLMDVFGAAGKG